MIRLTLMLLLSSNTLPLLAKTTDSSVDTDKMKTLFQCGTSTPLSVTLETLSALPTDNGDSEKMKVLFQCGKGTERGFNGWKLQGVSDETNTYFEKDHIEFFQHNPGFYSIGFEKRIEDMVGYTDIRMSAEVDAIENCTVNTVTAYFSQDGKRWTPVNKDARDGAEMRNEKMDFSFVRIVANITFFKEGRFRMNRAAIFGKYAPKRELKVRKDRADINTADISLSPNMNQSYEAFNVFAHKTDINIETQSEDEYEFVLSNLLGQVVHKEKSSGSRRFMLDVPDGIYVVIIIQHNQHVTTKKVVL